MRFRSNAMLTHVGVGGATTYLTTEEHYNTLEAWVGWNMSNRFRIIASIPYGFNEKQNQGVVQRKNGVGDISASGYYRLLNTRKTLRAKLLVQDMWIGAGVKLATGQYNPSDKTPGGQNTNLFQLGTGSYDINLNVMYDVRLQDAGLNLNTGYKINTANRYDYSYGNKFSGSLQAYYKFRVQQRVMLAPNAGIQYEHSAADRDGDVNVTVSGGNLLLGTIGIEGAWGKISFGANWQTPLQQNLANGIVRAQNRGMVSMGVLF